MPPDRRMPDDLARARRVLAIRLDNIGDVVMAGPAFRAIAEALPGAEITLLASRAGAQAAPLLPAIGSVIVHRPLWQDTLGAVPFDPDRELEFAASLRDRAFDACFVFTSFRQSADVPGYVAYLAGIPIRVGHAPLFSGGLFTLPVDPPAFEAHQVDRNLSLVEAAGIPVTARDTRLAIPDEAVREAATVLADQGLDRAEKYLVVAPGASAAARRYDANRFGRLVGLIGRELGLPVALVGSDREIGLVAEVCRIARETWPSTRVATLAGRTGVPTLAAVIDRAALVITNDSGSMHIADALGRSQLVLFAGTELESQWQPRQSPSVLLRRPTACAPCYLAECPFGLPCLDIPPERVLAEVAELLARQPGFETFSSACRTGIEPARRTPRTTAPTSAAAPGRASWTSGQPGPDAFELAPGQAEP